MLASLSTKMAKRKVLHLSILPCNEIAKWKKKKRLIHMSRKKSLFFFWVCVAKRNKKFAYLLPFLDDDYNSKLLQKSLPFSLIRSLIACHFMS